MTEWRDNSEGLLAIIAFYTRVYITVFMSTGWAWYNVHLNKVCTLNLTNQSLKWPA